MSEKFEGGTPPQEGKETKTDSFGGIDIISKGEAKQQFPNLFEKSDLMDMEKGKGGGKKLPENFHWYSGAAAVPENVRNVHYFNPETEAELGQKIIDGARKSFEKVYLYRQENGSVAVVVDTRSKIAEKGKE